MIQTIVHNTPIARERYLVFPLFAEDGISPYTGSLTGVKALYKINGLGTQQTGTQDLAYVTSGSSAMVMWQLTQAESNVPAVGDYLEIYLAPSAGQHLGFFGRARVIENDWSGGSLTLDAMQDHAIEMMQTIERTNTTLTINNSAGTPVVMPVTTDDTLDPIATISSPA